VHGVGGLVGMLLLGVFAAAAINPAGHDGLGSGGGLHLLGQQSLASVVTMAYAFGATFAVGKAVNAVMRLRVSPAEEDEGLDNTQHSETAYSGTAYGRMT